LRQFWIKKLDDANPATQLKTLAVIEALIQGGSEATEDYFADNPGMIEEISRSNNKNLKTKASNILVLCGLEDGPPAQVPTPVTQNLLDVGEISTEIRPGTHTTAPTATQTPDFMSIFDDSVSSSSTPASSAPATSATDLFGELQIQAPVPKAPVPKAPLILDPLDHMFDTPTQPQPAPTNPGFNFMDTAKSTKPPLGGFGFITPNTARPVGVTQQPVSSDGFNFITSKSTSPPPTSGFNFVNSSNNTNRSTSTQPLGQTMTSGFNFVASTKSSPPPSGFGFMASNTARSSAGAFAFVDNATTKKDDSFGFVSDMMKM